MRDFLLLLGGLALFPELHVLHFLAAGALEALADKGSVGLQAPFPAVGIGIKAVLGEVLAGDEFEDLATFKAGDGFFLDGTGGSGAEFGIRFFLHGGVRHFLQAGGETAYHVHHFLFLHDADRGLGSGELYGKFEMIVHVILLGKG